MQHYEATNFRSGSGTTIAALLGDDPVGVADEIAFRVDLFANWGRDWSKPGSPENRKVEQIMKSAVRRGYTSSEFRDYYELFLERQRYPNFSIEDFWREADADDRRPRMYPYQDFLALKLPPQENAAFRMYETPHGRLMGRVDEVGEQFPAVAPEPGRRELPVPKPEPAVIVSRLVLPRILARHLKQVADLERDLERHRGMYHDVSSERNQQKRRADELYDAVQVQAQRIERLESDALHHKEKRCARIRRQYPDNRRWAPVTDEAPF